jgi:hypothetical protein
MTVRAEPEGWRERSFIDFPTAWWLVEQTVPAQHHTLCSWFVTQGSLICDCQVVPLLWERLR